MDPDIINKYHQMCQTPLKLYIHIYFTCIHICAAYMYVIYVLCAIYTCSFKVTINLGRHRVVVLFLTLACSSPLFFILQLCKFIKSDEPVLIYNHPKSTIFFTSHHFTYLFKIENNFRRANTVVKVLALHAAVPISVLTCTAKS